MMRRSRRQAFFTIASMMSGVAPPPAPTNLAITGASGGVVADLTPEATWDAAAGAVTYTLQYGTASDFTGATEVTGIATTSYTIPSDLDNLTTYYFRVAAVNAGGQGAWSDSVSVQTAVYLLNDSAPIDDAAPLSTPANAVPGPGIRKLLADVGNDIAASGGDYVVTEPGGAWNVAVLQWAQSGDVGWDRAQGLCLKVTVTTVITESKIIIGWDNTDAVNFPSDHVFYFTGSGNGICTDLGEAAPRTISPVGVQTYDLYIPLRAAGGARWYVKPPGSNIRLYWRTSTGTDTPLKVKASINLRGVTISDPVIAQLPAPFDTDAGTMTLNVASPAEQDYTATADQMLDITLTAPGSITEEAGIIYRKLDANNYWWAGFTTAGAFEVRQVSGGSVASTPISVAGAIAAGQTRTIRIVCAGSLHDAFTISSGNPTKRGSQINVSHQNTQTTVQPDIGSGWAASNLISEPYESALYDVLENA